MKRSEMIEKVNTVLDEFYADHRELFPYLTRRILDTIEKNGMIPPTYIKPLKYDGGFVSSAVTLIKWEPEDV